MTLSLLADTARGIANTILDNQKRDTKLISMINTINEYINQACMAGKFEISTSFQILEIANLAVKELKNRGYSVQIDPINQIINISWK